MGDIIDNSIRKNGNWGLLPNRIYCSTLAFPSICNTGFNIPFCKFPKTINYVSKLNNSANLINELKGKLSVCNVSISKSESSIISSLILSYITNNYLKTYNSTIKKTDKDKADNKEESPFSEVIEFALNLKLTYDEFKEIILEFAETKFKNEFNQINNKIKAAFVKAFTERTSISKLKKTNKDNSGKKGKDEELTNINTVKGKQINFNKLKKLGITLDDEEKEDKEENNQDSDNEKDNQDIDEVYF